jgi:hypothetical protein
MVVELHGYKYSVYSWIARLALEEKGVRYDWVEINPFADTVPARYLDLHPFKRVPALLHGEFRSSWQPRPGDRNIPARTEFAAPHSSAIGTLSPSGSPPEGCLLMTVDRPWRRAWREPQNSIRG